MPWACTVLKVQGLSLAEGVVSFDLEKQKSFNQGKIYVALSRISSMNKMYLIGSYNKAALKVNKSAKKEYERLRSEGLFKSQSHLAVTETSITIALSNTPQPSHNVTKTFPYGPILVETSRTIIGPK